MADLGLRLGIEGEREFKQNLRDINQEFKLLGSEMNLIASQFDKNDKSVEALTARKQLLGREIDTQKDKISTLESALQNATESFGEGDKRTQAWAIQLNNAKAELNNMERELDSTTKALDAASDGFEDAGESAGDFSDEVESSGDVAEDAKGRFSGLESVLKGLGAALGTAMVAIGTKAVAAGKALNTIATESADLGVNVDQTSRKLGMSRQGFQEWDYVLTQSGASMYNMSYGMRNLQNAMGGVDEEGGKVGKAIERLGLNFDDIRRKSPEDAMNSIVAAFQEMPESTEKTNMALEIFGRRAGMELQPLLNSTSEELEELRQRAHDLGIVMGDDLVDASVAFGNAQTDLEKAFQGVKNNIAAELLPGLASVKMAFADIVAGQEGAGEALTEGMELLVEGISAAIPQLLDMVGMVISTIAEIAPDVVAALVNGIVDNLPMIIETAATLIDTLIVGIMDTLPVLLEGAVQIVTALITGIADSLPKLIPAVVEMVMLIVETLLDNLPMFLEAALQLILGLADGLLAAIPRLIEALPKIITSIVEFLIGAIPQIIEAGIELLTSIIDALPEIITAIVAAIPQIIDGLVTAILGSIPQLIEAGINLLVSLIQSLPQIITTLVGAIPQIISGLVTAIIGSIPQIIQAGIELLISLITNLPMIIIEIVKAVPQIVMGIVEAFGGFFSTMGDVGLRLIQGLWQGISDAGAWLRDKISGFFGGVVDSIRNFFGIRSPSTLFAGLGVNMAEGLGLGFGEKMNQVGRDMRDAIPTDFDVDAKIRGGYSIDGLPGANGSAGGGGIVNNFHLHGVVVREEADIDKIADALYRKQQQSRRGVGIVFP